MAVQRHGERALRLQGVCGGRAGFPLRQHVRQEGSPDKEGQRQALVG